jgi:hypothetical protein
VNPIFRAWVYGERTDFKSFVRENRYARQASRQGLDVRLTDLRTGESVAFGENEVEERRYKREIDQLVRRMSRDKQYSEDDIKLIVEMGDI